MNQQHKPKSWLVQAIMAEKQQQQMEKAAAIAQTREKMVAKAKAKAEKKSKALMESLPKSVMQANDATPPPSPSHVILLDAEDMEWL